MNGCDKDALFDLYLKTASVSWPDMQDAGHAAVIVYHECPATKQIQ
jgi:hypothetical protein